MIALLRYINQSEAEYYAELMEVKLKLYELKLRLGIKRGNMNGLKPGQLRFLFDNYGKYSAKELGKILNRNESTIRTILQKYALTYKQLNDNEISVCNLFFIINGKYNDSYKKSMLIKYDFPAEWDKFPAVIDINKFYEWYQQHLDILDLFAYKIGSLPNEPDWFIEKAKADVRAAQYTYKRKWTKAEDDLLLFLIKNKADYKTCSMKLKRTGNAIKRRCYDLKISKPKRNTPRLWTDFEKYLLKRLWLKGYKPCIIAEELDRNDREIQSMLERYKYYGRKPLKFS